MPSDELPAYSIRASRKARYLQLRIRPTGIEVVVPEKLRLSPAAIERFVSDKKSWIQKYAGILACSSQKPGICPLPASVSFVGLNEDWQIIYRLTDSKRVNLKIISAQQIAVEGAILNEINCVMLLKRWLKQKAAFFLEKRLRHLADNAQLTFSLFTVRDMISRWGSCSSQKKINLCTNLIFLPAHLIDHVLLHELCHTKYMSHGKRFWGLLEKLDDDARKKSRELKDATKFIPSWALRI